MLAGKSAPISPRLPGPEQIVLAVRSLEELREDRGNETGIIKLD